MYISEIELNNFKSYQYQQFVFPPINHGKHIVLIGGLNGYGKTSFLEAIYLGLYGADSISHLGRAGLSNKTYKKFIQSSYYAMATPSQKMSVRIDFQIDKNRGFSIRRSWWFDKDKNFTGEEQVELYPLNMGVKEKVLPEERLNEILEEHLLPVHLAPFFFFDGEEVKQIANQDKIEQVKQGMEGLLGVVILRSLFDRLLQFQISQRQQVPNIDEETLKATEQKWREEEEAYNQACEELRDLEAQKATIENELQSITNRLISIGGGKGIDVASTKDLIEKKHLLQKEKDITQDRLDEMLTIELPLSLVRNELYEQLTEQLEKEKRRNVYEIQKRDLSPKRDIFSEKYIQYAADVIFKLDEDDQNTIKNSINKAWRDLFYPPQENIASQIFHDYMTDDQRNKIVEICGTKSVCLTQIEALNKEIDDLKKEIDKCQKDFDRIEGISNDGTLQSLKEDLERLRKDEEQIITQISDSKHKITMHKSEMDNAKASLERMNNQLRDSTPANELIDKAEKIRQLINELIPSLYSIKTRQLSESMTSIFKKLSHEQNIYKIKVIENGETHFLNNQGQDVGFDRSAGEDQLFATTLLASLAKVSNIKAPLIVDTPLGRLDSKHRKNILNFWTSDKERQLILLSQDEEIRPEVLKSINESVLKKYLLQYEPMGDGIGRTRAIEGYFGE